MDNVRIRGFEARDAPDIVRLHQANNQWFEEEALSVDYVTGCSLRSDFRFFIAESSGVLTGFSGVLFYESVGRAEIGPICVSESYRMQGLGSRLLESVMDFLSQKSVHRVVARVKSGNELGASFFCRNGFRQEAFLQNYTKRGESVVQLVRLLHS